MKKKQDYSSPPAEEAKNNKVPQRFIVNPKEYKKDESVATFVVERSPISSINNSQTNIH